MVGDEALAKLRQALSSLDLNKSDIDEQISKLGEGIMLEVTLQLAKNNPGVTADGLNDLTKSLPGEELAQIGLQATRNVLNRYLDRIEQEYSVEKRLAIETAISL
jgi:hypothetical protein